jgi:hypothetical protein
MPSNNTYYIINNKKGGGEINPTADRSELLQEVAYRKVIANKGIF